MKEINLNDLIKALRCLASNDPEGNCYEDQYNFGNDGQRISYYGSPETIKCPYHQNTYDVCFEDGDCCEWLGDAAKLLEELQQYQATGLTAKMVEALKENDKRSHQIAVRYATELDDYHAIGTPEECREARGKQIAKKPYFEGDGYSDGKLVYDTWICPYCGKHFEVDYDDYDYCPECGQAIDWGEE